jgi:hypothetical protein
MGGASTSPRPPGTAPRAPAASSPALPPPPVPSPSKPRAPSTPDDLAWDDAEELRPSSIIPLDGTPTPRAAETAPLPVDPPSIPEVTEPVRIVPVPAEPMALSPQAEEQLFAVLRASLEASLLPLVEKQRELEARVEALRTAGAAKVAVRATSPTMPLGPAAPAASVKPVMTTYGLVTPSVAPKPALDLENVGPIEVPNFGKSRVGTVLVVLLVIAVVGAIIAAVASHG